MFLKNKLLMHCIGVTQVHKISALSDIVKWIKIQFKELTQQTEQAK